MARTIESPGVEINEIDLSLNTNIPVGTYVLVNGFAPQGPTIELTNITSKSELEQVYGQPTTEAERYFYHTCNEVLNSNANLVVNRLPYGEGSGAGFGDNYSALFYPVSGCTKNATAVTASKLSALNLTLSAAAAQSIAIDSEFSGGYDFSAQFVGINDPDYVYKPSLDVILTRAFYTTAFGGATASEYATYNYVGKSDGTISFTTSASNASTFDGFIPTLTLDYATGILTVVDPLDITYTLAASATFEDKLQLSVGFDKYQYTNTDYVNASAFLIGAPTLLPLSESDYLDIKSGQIAWSQSQGAAAAVGALGNCGFVVVNEAKVSTDEMGQGYYIGLVSNDSLNRLSSPQYDSITAINTVSKAYISALNVQIDESSLNRTLTGTDTQNANSISEYIESGWQYDFTDPSYNDSIILTYFRLRTTNTSQNENKLDIGYSEKYIGSFDKNDVYRTNPRTLQQETFFLQSKINDGSGFMKMYVNPNIAKEAIWTNGANGRIAEVRVMNKEANAIGMYASNKAANTNKAIGDVVAKLEKAMLLVEDREITDVDIVCEGGLGTIFAYAKLDNASNPTKFNPATQNVADYIDQLADPDTGATSTIAQYYRSVYNVLANLAQQTRKDCILIADPLRGIFVQGEDFKVSSRKDLAFSQSTYWPLKNLYGSANSNYVATYGNYVKAYDSASGDFVWLPFSGFQAAIMARMDANLYPWYAPAGLESGIVRNIVDIAVNPSQKQRDLLYKIGVNPVVFFPRDAYVVWGQKTLQAKPSAFDRINVRRLFLVLEKAVLRLAKYFVMQPNTVFTRTRFVNAVKPIFDIAKQNEGVYDYMIVCDERNNTPTVIDNNEMVADIYIKAVRTAEFIRVNFIATRTDQDFNELI